MEQSASAGKSCFFNEGDISVRLSEGYCSISWDAPLHTNSVKCTPPRKSSKVRFDPDPLPKHVGNPGGDS